jgi:hypothetical protein
LISLDDHSLGTFSRPQRSTVAIQMSSSRKFAADEGLFQELSGFIDDLAHANEVDVGEDRHQAQLAQDWEEVLDHPRSAKRSRRHTRDPGGFMVRQKEG